MDPLQVPCESLLYKRYGLKLNQKELLIVRCLCCNESLCRQCPNLFELTCDRFFKDLLSEYYTKTNKKLSEELKRQGLVMVSEMQQTEKNLSIQIKFRSDLVDLLSNKDTDLEPIPMHECSRDEWIRYLLQLACIRNLQRLETSKYTRKDT